MYTFELTVKKEESRLALYKAGSLLAEKAWPESRDMGVRLFEAIEALLKKEGLAPEAVSDFVVHSQVPEMSTSGKIAETVKRVYAFGVRAKSNTAPTQKSGE